MKCITLPFGNEGWNERIRTVERIVSSRPHAPFIYNDILILVPSSRMKRMYGRLFLDALRSLCGASALIQPEVQTLHQFFENLYAQLRGPRLIDENTRLILLEGIVKERLTGNTLFSQSPDLLAPSLSSSLAKMIEQLSAAGAAPEDLFAKVKDADFIDKPQVQLLIDVYTRYMAVLEERNLTDPAGMCSRLLKEFDPSWLMPYRQIIIDGIQDAGKIEAGLLRKVAVCNNCTYLIDAPSPELLNSAKDFHPLRTIKDFILSLDITPAQDGTTANSDDLFLATALFSEKPFEYVVKNAPTPSSFLKRINLLSVVNTREEVSLIARMVKKSIRSGTLADTVLVAFPALDDYGPLVEEIFSDYGIPFNRALGRQLSASPVTTSMVSLLRACQENFSGPSLLRIFSSPFLKFAEQPNLAPSLDRLMRDHSIIGGRDKLLLALKYHTSGENGTDILTAPLNDLFDALEPFSKQQTAPLGIWMDRLDALTAWSGLGARVAAMYGPLNINLQAYRKLNEILASLTHAGKLFPEYTYTFNEWLFLLKKTFMHARFQVPPEDEGGVQILGLEESTGRQWNEIYLGGLMDGKFPQRLPQNIFLPDATLEALGVHTLEHARLNAAYHFYRLLLSAEKVTLTLPENERDRPIVPSPFLQELTPLRKAGLLNQGIENTSSIQFTLKIEDSYSIPELAKAVSIMSNIENSRGVLPRTEWLTDLSDKMPDLFSQIHAIKSAIEYMPAEPIATAVPQQKRKFRVTELDDYINCPYDYYIKHVLGIEPLEEVTEDISPLDRGSKVHAILRNFYLSWNKPVMKENREEARALIEKLADSAFDEEADTIRNRRQKYMFLNVMTERFLNAEEALWKQGLQPAYLEQKIEQYHVVLSNGMEVELSGKIDRIDVEKNGNFIIVDYKTGKYPQPKMNLEQEIFQLPVYAVMAQQALSDKEPMLRKPIGLAYYDLAGKTGAGARDVVLFNREARNDHPSSKPKASPKSAEEFETILKLSIDKARKAVEGILAGDFSAKPRDENKCRYCPNEMMCGEKLS